MRPLLAVQARDFYGKALGLDELRRPETLSDRHGIWYSAPPGHVHLSADEDLGLHPRRHFALRVDDLDATRNRLRDRGARFEEAIRSGTRSSWTRSLSERIPLLAAA